MGRGGITRHRRQDYVADTEDKDKDEDFQEMQIRGGRRYRGFQEEHVRGNQRQGAIDEILSSIN